jgi:hypothetical protein
MQGKVDCILYYWGGSLAKSVKVKWYGVKVKALIRKKVSARLAAAGRSTRDYIKGQLGDVHPDVLEARRKLGAFKRKAARERRKLGM